MTVSRKPLLALVMLALFGLSPARAETAGELLQICQSDANKCDDAIFGAQLAMVADRAKNRTFCVPNKIASRPMNAFNKLQTKPVLDWIKARPDLNDSSSAKAIELAYQAAFPPTQACRDSYGHPIPSSTGGFLSYCKKGDQGGVWGCREEILEVEILMARDGPNVACAIAYDPATQNDAFHKEAHARDVTILAWLGNHPELSDRPRRDGIRAAIVANYPPCGAQ